MSRTILFTVAMCGLPLIPGCVIHERYGDQAVQESERAVVEGYWRFLFLYDEELHIVSVDGNRDSRKSGWPYAYSVSLPSGTHWLQLAILRNSRDIAMCAFEWTFEAAHHYKLQRVRHDQFPLAHPASPRFVVSLSMVVGGPSQPARELSAPGVCGTGPFCRRDEDCPRPNSCQMDAAFEFGNCASRGR